MAAWRSRHALGFVGCWTRRQALGSARAQEEFMISQYLAQTPVILRFAFIDQGFTGSRDHDCLGPEDRVFQPESARPSGIDRTGQKLASDLAGLGLDRGDTVAIMDSESHRYSECFFAVPRIGTILRTVNVRLLAEHFLYTINYAVRRGAFLLPLGVRICRGHP
jgi:hypothetical protein